MPELHRQPDDRQLGMVHDPAAGRDPSAPAILTPDAIRRTIASGYLQRAVPTLCEIRAARDDGRLTQTQADDFLGRLQAIVQTELGTDILERYPEPKELERLFGQNYLGPKAVKQTWGVEVSPTRLSPMPFDTDDLERSAKRGELLRLRVSHAPDGTPLTPKRMAALREPALRASGREFFFDPSWYQGEDFYSTETPTDGWALTTSANIPGSQNQNYLEQTRLGAEYLHASVFAGQDVAPVYAEALQAFETYAATRFSGRTPTETEALLRGEDFAIYASELANLRLTHLIRPSAAELIYDLEVTQEAAGAYLLSRNHTWTRSRGRNGGLVSLGVFDVLGLASGSFGPGSASHDIGLLFSRSQ